MLTKIKFNIRQEHVGDMLETCYMRFCTLGIYVDIRRYMLVLVLGAFGLKRFLSMLKNSQEARRVRLTFDAHIIIARA